MRIEAKRKFLSEAVSRVAALTTAAAPVSVSVPIHLVAEPKRLLVRTALGGQLISSVVREAIVEEPGVIALNPDQLLSAMKVSGDIFKAAKVDGDVHFVCGRAKGRLPLVDFGAEQDPWETPDTVLVHNFKGLLKATSLKSKDVSRDRTLHFEATGVRIEATDTERGIVAVQKFLEPPAEAVVFSFNLPPKFLDALEGVLEGDGDSVIGVGDRFMTLRCGGLSLAVPRSSTPPLEVQKQMAEWLATQTRAATYEVTTKELSSALADAQALVKEGGKLSILFAQGRTRIIGTGDGTAEVDVEFDATTTSTDMFTAAIVPSYLAECLRFYVPEEVLTLELYEQTFIINPKEPRLLAKQMTACPYGDVLQKGEPVVGRVKKKAKKAKAEEDDA